MKKVLLIITLFLLLPTTTLAKTYELKNSEIIISFDDENWTVATRENVRNSSLVKKYNMNYKDIESLLEKNSAYAYAINNDNVKKILEFFVVSPEMSFGYDDNQINEFGEILVEETGADSYTIYENDYKYINKQRIEMFPAGFFKRDSCYNWVSITICLLHPFEV